MSIKRSGLTRIAAPLLMVLLMLAVAVAVASGEDSSEAAELSSSEGAARLEELPGRATATSNTYLLENGSLETQIFQVPVNYRDEEGDWRPIDESLVAASDGDVVNGDNGFDLHLPENLDEDPIRVSMEDVWISQQPIGLDVEPLELDLGTASYPVDNGSAELEFSGLANGLKENIVLGDPSVPPTFSFRLEASAGVEPALLPDGAIEFRDADRHLVGTMPAPYMIDSAGVAAPAGDVRFRLDPAEGEAWTLMVEADRDWLAAPERQWPVKIDPTVTISGTALECVIVDDGAEISRCGPTQSYLTASAVFTTGSPAQKSRSLMRFDTSAIPKTASITSATVGLYADEAAKNIEEVGVWSVNKAWNNGVTWRWRRSPHSTAADEWAHPGGDYPGQPYAGIKTATRGSGPGWWHFESSELGFLVQQWVDGLLPNDGLLVKLDDAEENSAPTAQLERKVRWRASNLANGPYLSIRYMTPASADSRVTSPTDGTKTAKRFLLGSAWEHSGVEGVTFQYNSGDGWRDIPENQVIDSKGQPVKWPIGIKPADRQTTPVYWDASGYTYLKSSADVQIRAVLKDLGGEDTYTKPVAGKVDKNAGSPKDAVAGIGPGNVDLLTGNFMISRTDLSIPGINSALEFSRSFSSRESGVEGTGVLGPGWKPSFPVEEAEGSAWTKVKIEELTEVFEGEPETYRWAAVSHADGGEIPFEESNNQFITPPELSGYVLTRLSSTEIALTDPSGTRTIFSNEGSGNEYLPKLISQTGGSNNRTKFTWEIANNKRRLKRLIAPSHKERTCNDPAWIVEGCRVLEFTYQSPATWGAPEYVGWRLSKITFNGGAGIGPAADVARFDYDSQGHLVAAWDPRISPPLKETYAYNADGQISTLAPPGQEPWTMQYGQIGGETSKGRLISVKRATLVESKPTGQSTIAYDVPLSKSAGGPYDMGVEAVGTWGQSDVPTDATAIFSPDEVPASPPSGWTRATVYYMDAEGQLSNVATPSGAGTTAPSITTTETDKFGNVTRELGAQNRLRALAEVTEKERLDKSRELDSQFRYSPDGTELQEEEGPMHQVRLESGAVTQARAYRAIQYDANFLYLNGTTTPSAGETKPHLPTSETSGALLPDQSVADKRTTKYIYDWKLRKAKEVISNPETSDELRSVTLYDPDSGLPTEIRQPKEASTGGGAGTTKIIYYRAGSFKENCQLSYYAGLPCKIEQAAQPGTPGQPNLPVRRFLSYAANGQPSKITETSGSATREIVSTYDAAGRRLTKKIIGGGVVIPKVQTEYSESLGVPIAQRFVCASECGNPQFLTSVGGSGEGQTPLKNPTDAVVDAGGNIWVVDQGNNRVVEYNQAGEFVRELGGFGSSGGKLNKPSAIAIDSFGLIDVTDTANNRVARFTAAGVFHSVIGANVNKTKAEAGGTVGERNRCTAASGDVCQAGTAGSAEGLMSEPVGITTSGGGNFFVVERANNRVEKFNLSGELLAKFGGLGSGSGQLKEPTAIATSPAGALWVADTGNHRIEQWNSSLTFVRTVGKEGTGNGEFKKPAGIEVDSSGKLWVAEREGKRIQKLGETGEFLLKFGVAGTQEGQFSSPEGITSDGKGNLLLADAGNNRVQMWSTSGFDTQETTTAYDKLGRATTYKDADGNEAKVTFDYLGRPITQSDGKGTEALSYDSVTGLLTELEDSAAGKFTASYDADGQMVKQGLPNGLTRETAFDEAGEATALTYTKASNCGTSCTWLSNTVQRSIQGQILLEDGTLGKDEYAYDKLGRLTAARETLAGGSCTTRTYSYDKDSNRTGMATIPGVAGACSSAGGTTRSYSYDSADRLLATDLTYDDFGRITSLPGEFVGGKTLATSYFSNDMVATQTQDGVTNSFQLDAQLRHRQRLQAGGLQGTEVFHYTGPSDSPAWTQRGTSWTRNITGIGGDLAAIQVSGKEVELQLINIHGDVSATAALSPAVTSLKSTSTFDEFGNRTSGGSGPRFGWLGGKQRRTELKSGVIQMGVRSYVPQLGRFLTPDPVFGGSANPYDYANQDPINNFDLTGEKCAGTKAQVERCKKWKEGARKKTNKVRRRLNRLEEVFARIKERHTEQLKSSIAPDFGWFEDQVNGAIEKSQSVLSKIANVPCGKAGVYAGSAGVFLEKTGARLIAAEYPEVGAIVSTIGGASTLAGGFLLAGHEAGLC